jgi:hypothetical protein
MAADLFVVTPWSQPTSCYSVLVEPPTEELHEVEQGKLRAGLSWAPGDPRDQLMRDWIMAARQKVEADTGLALLTQIRDVFFNVPEVGWFPLPSQCTPTQSIEETAESRQVSLQWLVGAGGRAVGPAGSSGVLRVTAGWLNPESLRTQAPLLYQAVGLLVAHWATLGRDLAITGAVASVNVIPEGYAACIEPHRLIWVP